MVCRSPEHDEILPLAFELGDGDFLPGELPDQDDYETESTIPYGEDDYTDAEDDEGNNEYVFFDELSEDDVEADEFPIDEEGHRILLADDPDEYRFWQEHGVERWRIEQRENEDEDDDEDWEPEPHEVRYDIDTWNREINRLPILVQNEEGLGFPLEADHQPNDLDLILMNNILEDEPGAASFEQWCRCILLAHVSGDISTDDMVLELTDNIDECQSDMEEGYPNLRILTTGVRWMEDYLTDADVFQKYANDYNYYRNWRQHIEDNQPIQ